MPDAPPLPSGDAEPPVEAAPAAEGPAPSAPAAPAAPAFKPSTFVLTFLFLLGIWMILDSSMRIEVAGAAVGFVFWPLIGFHGQYPLLTMAIAAAIEMLLTAIAYNWATDWVAAAKVQKWSAAFRKVQMAAFRSGKKDRLEALQPKQQELTRLSSEVSIAQLKGMAVTWFLVIAIYTWVYLFLVGWSGEHAGAAVTTVNLAGSTLNLTKDLVWIIPSWFVIFTFFTIPYSLLFRRILKDVTLRRRAERLPAPAAEPAAAGGAA